MSVLIKGAKKPENCSECFYLNECKSFDERNSTEQAIRLFAIKGRDPNCPLVEIPPHGRLIDADETKQVFGDYFEKVKVARRFAKSLVDNAIPTVIESEDE